MNILLFSTIAIVAGAIFFLTDKKRSSRKIAKAIAYEIAAQAILDNCAALELIDRATLLRAHNGGDLTKTYSPKYITVIYEGESLTATSVKGSFQSYPLDGGHKKMLVNLISEKTIIVEVEKEETGFLKRRQELDEIKVSYLALIGTTSNSIYYCDFSTKKTIQDFLSNQSYTQIEAQANKLRLLHRAANRIGLIE